MTTVLQALNAAMHDAMARDERVYFLGEDILDPYGGAFKVARGLSTRFPARVLTTPISEAGIVGIANGMALRGLRPVVEIMFGDFITLIFDQIANHAAKFRWMYNDQARVPLVVRTPMGGRRGYGPTHSQSLEKHFLGTPGLRVVAPNTLNDPQILLTRAILEDDDPVLFVEHKLLYNKTVRSPELVRDLVVTGTEARYPTSVVTYRGMPAASATFACYGYQWELVREAMEHLVMDEEIFTEAVVFTQLSDPDYRPLLDSLRRTGRLITVEESSATAGWGSEVISAVLDAMGPAALKAARRVGALDVPLACTRALEEYALPGVDDIVSEARRRV